MNQPVRLPDEHAALNTALLRAVQVSRIEGGLALVDSGLAAGERIVTSGHYRVQPGGPVQVLDEPEAVPATKPVADKVD